ncbi:MAG: zinc ribbon domain-containing protein [Clostridia bacterium]|nr:zinc ribbon domain-containing protein [Clostridia bacterium]
MFCGNCGHQNDDNMAFCTECGSPLTVIEQPQPQPQPQYQPQYQPQPVAAGFPGKSFITGLSEKNKKIGMITVAGIAVLLIILLISLFGGRGYKSTVKKFVKYQFDGNAKGIVNMMPKKLLREFMDEEDMSKRELIEELEESLEESREYLEDYYGDHLKVTCKIKNDRNIRGDDLDDIKEDYEDYDIKVSAAKSVRITLKIKGSDDSTSIPMTIPVVKIGNSWYVDLMNYDIF